MTIAYLEQETASSNPSRKTSNITIDVPDATIGGKIISIDNIVNLMLSDNSRIFYKAIQELLKVEDNIVVEQSLELFLLINETLNTLSTTKTVIDFLPPLQPSFFVDGSVVFEFIQSEFRLGINIETDPAISSWYLVTKQNLGSINAQGYLSSGDKKNLIVWLLTYVISNS